MKNQIKKFTLIALSLFCFISSCVSADPFETEGSATLASMYLWRGLDVSQEDPAIQADFIVNHQSGFWIGAWGTTYDIGVDDGLEIDFIGGYNYAVNDSFSIGAGFTEYTFTGDTDSSTEFYLTASLKQFTLTYNEDIDLKTTYISLDAEFELAEELSLALHAADYSFDDGSSHNEYNIGLSYAATEKVSLTGLYSVNDLDVPGAEDYFVVSVSYAF